MIKKVARVGGLGGLVLLATTACQTVTMDRIKVASAGRTGCTPDQVAISNLQKLGEFTGNASWNATCNGEVYLCTVLQTGNAQDYSCAPAAR
jgi:hypothetical protein